MTRARSRIPPGRDGGLIPPDRSAQQLIESYLTAVGDRLPGPARAREAIVAELRAGLLDASDGHRGAGRPPAEAAASAVAEFGDPRLVAEAFRPGLAGLQARHLALGLLVTGPLIGLLWAAAAVASHIGIRAAPPWQWAGTPPGALAAFPVAAAAIVVAVWTALLTVAVTGRLTRRLGDHPRLAQTTAVIAGFGATAVDLIILLLLAGQLVAAPGRLAPAPIAAAAVASLTRIIAASRAARRCLAARAALA